MANGNIFREHFESRFKASDFSKDFLKEENIRRITDTLDRIEHSEGVEERLAQFIVHWDENMGYDNTPAMIRDAQDNFLRHELRRRDEEGWLRQFQIINPLTTDDLKPLETARDSRARENDFGRRDANDRERGTISDAARCYILRTPYRGSEQVPKEDEVCQTTQDAGSRVTPYIMRPENIHPHPSTKMYSRRVQRYF